MLLSKYYLNKIFQIFYKNNHSPKSELNYKNHYTLLVAVVLSAQSTDISVNKATKKLFEDILTPKDIIDLGEENLKKYIKTIGLFNNKAKNIMSLSKSLIENYNGEVPDSFDSLVKLPGVGIKTANVVLNAAFGHKTIAVDTHVFRVSNRIGIVKEKKIDKVGDLLLKNIPKKWHKNAHHWLILHGRYVCTARNPRCINNPGECLIEKHCQKNNI